MASTTPVNPSELFVRATLALGGQKYVGEVLGVSRRTVNRWGPKSAMTPGNARLLAVALAPTKFALAAELATFAGTTLRDLGVVVKGMESPAPAAATSDPATKRHLVQSVLCAAAEALDASPRAARPVVLAAFAQTIAAKLTLEDVVTGLGEPAVRARKAPKA
jgi:hypothetical protein